MDLPEPRTQVPADRPPEFLRVVRSGLEGLEHPEQAPVGVALLGQGESLVERQVGGLLPRMVALEGGLVAQPPAIAGWPRFTAGKTPEVRRRQHRADGHRDQAAP